MTRCYTCKPRGKIKKHIISYSPCSQYIFHHDMGNRPLIIVTTSYHAINIQDVKDILSLYNSIQMFCEFWKIGGYQVLMNCGSWKTHEHFHVKIKIDKKIAKKMKSDHFKKINLCSYYNNNNNNNNNNKNNNNNIIYNQQTDLGYIHLVN